MNSMSLSDHRKALQVCVYVVGDLNDTLEDMS